MCIDKGSESIDKWYKRDIKYCRYDMRVYFSAKGY